MYTFIFIFWVILNQKITVEILAFGVIITVLAALLMKALFDYNIQKEKRILKKAPLFLYYVLILIVEIIKSSASIARIIVDKGIIIEPVLVTFRSGLKTEFGNFMLANSITLTPGTITVSVHGDELTVHCLRRDFLDVSENSTFIRLISRLESR